MLLSEIASRLGISLKGSDMEISGVNTLAEASESELSFLANPKYAPQLETTGAGAVLVSADQAPDSKSCLISANPYLDFARAVQLFAKPQGSFEGMSPLAFVHEDASIDPSAAIAPFVFIGRGARVGARVRVFSGSYIGEDCVVDEDAIIYPNCSLMAGTLVGKRVILHAGTVLGSDGFGFAQAASGMTKFPQIGRTVIEDDVEIGANTTIDRAALGETRVGQGTKIDNLVQLGHNVRVGRNCIIVSQVGIAGSTTLGNGVVLAGQVGVAGHINLGDGCRIGAKSGVGKDVPPGQDLSGIPVMSHGAFLRTSAIMPKLPEMKRRLGKLEKELAALREELANKGK
ncbi:UDP-3-O-[3-hydroxymyristoyl] glucosamine N-acyltransferase [Desulfomicrobium norvegicum]|uniref:UDP-3-O-acylglucosamine N-acyltransferase n=1 Tax=Desulfomicrobium norvegicum (strain DSM 1741 / NCIMB 8310) TaxID=52561 RepID=A0A8G2C4H8_DESNO|nr:UDP-3-O-(3-hydroxymyristoyl)glucosamine N-acyltransferase [Desulfomicrobium norvegicum]SFL96754.1 UDP-3-O-[3-hydroxymyristoyl] glucosamine N-acyltransferase [Desulfomicrobium norvegicum]